MNEQTIQLSEINDVARLLQLGEQKCEAKRCERIASILQQHVQDAESFDAKSVVESTFQRRTWRCLYKVIQLIEACKWRFDKDVVSPVSSTEKVLQEAIGAAKDKNPRKRVLQVIDNAIKLGIMKCEVDFYSQKNGIAKLYSFNKQIYQDILSFYSQSSSKSKIDISSIVKASCPSQCLYNICTRQESSDSQDIVEEPFDESRICISKRMCMNITNVSISRILAALDKRYPQFAEGRSIADSLNKSLPPEEQIKWQWNLETKEKAGKKFLVKIGFRATNRICNYKEHENENPGYSGKWRKDYLQEVYGKEHSQYDFNASIWRLSYNLCHDKPIDEHCDVYETAAGHKFESKEERALFKSIAMRLYFGGINQLGVQVERTFHDYAKQLGEKYEYDRERMARIQEIMSDGKLEAISNIGAFYDSEIFLHESFIYLNIYADILKSGIRCSQIYDGFYWTAGIDIDVNKLYMKHLEDYKRRFSGTFSCITEDDLVEQLEKHAQKQKNEKNKNAATPADDIVEDDKTTFLLAEIEKMLSQVVYKGLMGLSTANSIASELNIDKTFKCKDQPRGFSYTNEAGAIYEEIKRRMPGWKKQLNIKNDNME